MTQIAARNVLFDLVEKLWFGGRVAQPHRSRAGKIVRDLKALEATPDDVETRVGRYKRQWPKMVCTPEAIVKHWHTLSQPTPREKTKAGANELYLRQQQVRDQNEAEWTIYEAQERSAMAILDALGDDSVARLQRLAVESAPRTMKTALATGDPKTSKPLRLAMLRHMDHV